MALPAGAVLLAAARTDPTGSLVTGAASVEEVATVAEEVVRLTKRRTIPRTMIPVLVPVPVPTIKAKFKATTMDMVLHHLKTLTIRVIPLLQVHTLPFQNSLVPIRITHPMKVRSEAMIEVFVSCMARPLLSRPNAAFRKESFVFLLFHQVHRCSEDIL